MAKTESFKTKLTIVGQEQIASFENKKGDDQPIFKVDAVTEEGTPVDKPLRTFHEDLPTGELIEFDVSPYMHKGEMTYTLKLPSKGRASKKDISRLMAQYSALADRVGALEIEVGELKGEVSRLRGLDSGEEKPF